MRSAWKWSNRVSLDRLKKIDHYVITEMTRLVEELMTEQA
jgi:hypothetical protein